MEHGVDIGNRTLFIAEIVFVIVARADGHLDTIPSESLDDRISK